MNTTAHIRWLVSTPVPYLEGVVQISVQRLAISKGFHGFLNYNNNINIGWFHLTEYEINS